MGSIGANTTTTAEKRSVSRIWEEDNLSYKSAVMNAYRSGQITKEQRDNAVSKMNKGAEEIASIMIDKFEDSNKKALISTMNRKLMLTSDEDISDHAELKKTANGFVLEAPGTRGNFRAFMDNDGNVRRMPNNEMKTVYATYNVRDVAREKFDKIWRSNN